VRGVLSALGLAIAPERREAAASVMLETARVDAAGFGATLDSLAKRAKSHGDAVRCVWHARVRYSGQGHELDILVGPGDDGAAVEHRFRAAHQLRYGYMLERSVEIVAVRVAAFGEAVPVEFGADGEPAVELEGPSVVSLADATMVVAPGWTARTLAIGGWMVERA